MRKPEQAARKPEDTASEPESSAPKPEGSASEREGSAREPGGSAREPGGSARELESSAPKPEGSARELRGSACGGGVREPGGGARPYHHGHLREALVDAALATARTDGPAAVVLRAATRAAGVSPNAAYRHFADRDDLLQAVAARCQEKMAALMQARLAEADTEPGPDGAWQQLRTVGHAYVEFALTEPGWFATAFATPIDAGPSQPGDGRDLFGILVSVLDDLVCSGAIAAEARPGAEYVAWSAVHGIATLLSGGSLRDLPDDERDAAIERVINAVAF